VRATHSRTQTVKPTMCRVAPFWWIRRARIVRRKRNLDRNRDGSTPLVSGHESLEEIYTREVQTFNRTCVVSLLPRPTRCAHVFERTRKRLASCQRPTPWSCDDVNPDGSVGQSRQETQADSIRSSRWRWWKVTSDPSAKGLKMRCFLRRERDAVLEASLLK
jgi:hypothetical protein